MNWKKLVSNEQLEEIRKESEENPILIFKHSTRCSTSRVSLDRLERSWKTPETNHIKPYFLDLLNYRMVSDLIAEHFGVEHESPQVLVIYKGESVLNLSHLDIDYDRIRKAVRN